MSPAIEASIILINQTLHKISPNIFHQTLERLLRQMNIADKLEMEVVLVTKRYIKKLNAAYRQENRATDILTFPQKEITKEGLIGSLLLSPQYIVEQLKDFNYLLNDELKFLFVHGFLHLKGYHHK